MLAVRLCTIVFVNKRLNHLHDKLSILDTFATELLARNVGLLEFPCRILIHPSKSIIVNSHNNHTADIWISLDGWDNLPGMSNVRFLTIKDVLSIVKIHHWIASIRVFFIVFWEENTYATLLTCVGNH